MILIIDNYDSFVHNLARYFRQLGHQTMVIRNDREIPRELKPSAIVISPGPCTPDESGCSIEVIKSFGSRIPMLGVCLGHQAIVRAFGGQIVRAAEPMHGRASDVFHQGDELFANLPSPLTAGRYHSLVADRHSLPNCLHVIATADDGTIMAIRHREFPIFGVQFHPESILTPNGYQLLTNFLTLAKLEARSVQTPLAHQH